MGIFVYVPSRCRTCEDRYLGYPDYTFFARLRNPLGRCDNVLKGLGAMSDRRTTNLLLAIIAAVLLFGSSAVTGALKWVAIFGAAGLFIYTAVAFFLYLIRETARELREAKAAGRDALILTIFGIVAIICAIPFLSYAILLWWDGVQDPFKAATDSGIGTVWLCILASGISAISLSFVYTHRTDVIPTLRYAFSLVIRSPLAPFYLTVYGWRKARMAGDGIISSTATAFLGLFSGFIVWAMLVGIFAPLLGF